jgi:hypothetical protein
MTRSLDLPTPAGPARAHLDDPVGSPRGLLVLGHGAGGGVQALDLVAVSAAASAAGWLAVRVEQPWRVAGRRVAPAPPRLDAAWLPALEHLLGTEPVDGPLVIGGRSAGARVACRTAVATGASAVLCLAFPLHPPGRPERSRLAELAAVAERLPVLAVQGRRDGFGTAAELSDVAPAGVTIVAVDGDHGLSAGAAQAAEAVVGWLDAGSIEGSD